MKTGVAFLAVLGVVGMLVVGVIFGFIGFQNESNRYENGIKAQYDNNRNVYDNGWKKVKEMAQVPELYTDQLKDLYDGTMTGRYGPNGSRALLQFIQEQNPTLDATLFRQIQQAIESFRNQFQQSQTELVARRQQYENYLTTNTSSRFYNWVSGGSYPKIDLTKYDIVTSDKTEEDFQRKKSEPLDLKPR